MPWKKHTPGCPCCDGECFLETQCTGGDTSTECCSDDGTSPCCVDITIEGLSAGGSYCTALNETRRAKLINYTSGMEFFTPHYQHTFPANDGDQEFQIKYEMDVVGNGAGAVTTGTVYLYRNGANIARWVKTLATGTARTDCKAWDNEEHTLDFSSGACVATGSKAYVTSVASDCTGRVRCLSLPDAGLISNPFDVEWSWDIPNDYFDGVDCDEGVLNGTTAVLSEGPGSGCLWQKVPIVADKANAYVRLYEISETQFKAQLQVTVALFKNYFYAYTFNKTNPMELGDTISFAYESESGTPSAFCFVNDPTRTLTLDIVAA